MLMSMMRPMMMDYLRLIHSLECAAPMFQSHRHRQYLLHLRVDSWTTVHWLYLIELIILPDYLQADL